MSNKVFMMLHLKKTTSSGKASRFGVSSSKHKVVVETELRILKPRNGAALTICESLMAKQASDLIQVISHDDFFGANALQESTHVEPIVEGSVLDL